MKSVRITFRLKPYQLAKGLQTIRQLEPAYKIISLNDIVKEIYHDYIAKMSLNRNESIAPELIKEIISFVGKSSQEKSLTLDGLINITTLNIEETKQELYDARQASTKQSAEELTAEEEATYEKEADEIIKESNEPADLTDEILAEIKKLSNSTSASKFNDPNETDSDISSITDFSPPKDWME